LNVGSGGGAAAAPAAGGAPTGGAAAAEEPAAKEEEKKEEGRVILPDCVDSAHTRPEKEESDEDMGFGLFD